MIFAYIFSIIGFLLSLWIYTYLHKHIVGRPWSFERKLALAFTLFLFIAVIFTGLFAAKLMVVDDDSLFTDIGYAATINSLGLLCGFAIVLGAFKNNKYFHEKLREEFDPDSIEYDFDMSNTNRRPGYSVKMKNSRTTNVKLLFTLSFIIAISSAFILELWFEPDTPIPLEDVVANGENTPALAKNIVANGKNVPPTNTFAATNAPVPPENVVVNSKNARAQTNWPSLSAN